VIQGARSLPPDRKTSRVQRLGGTHGYTLGQAAKASGKSKATIRRAVRAGRLSAARTESGGWLIEVAELHRVYPPRVSGDGVRDSTQPLANGVGRISEPGEVEVAARTDRGTGRDYPHLRDAMAVMAEHQRQLPALLTDQRARPWWRRWFR